MNIGSASKVLGEGDGRDGRSIRSRNDSHEVEEFSLEAESLRWC